MWFKKLKHCSVLLVLLQLLLSVQLSSFCYAEVVLTDQEAEIMLNEIQESKKDLQNLQTQLETVQNDYNEQKTSYEMQLTEAEKKNNRLETAVTITSTSTVVACALLFIVILL